MKHTWASGALELLKHAEDHMKLDSSFDRKIAFISIDNCVELTLKSYLSLPRRFWTETRPTRNELSGTNSFPVILDLIETYAEDKLDGIEINDIEHYHRIRNTLYHQGTGLSVNEEYVQLYYSIARILLHNLFDIDFESKSDLEYSLYSKILIGWTEIEQLINDILIQQGISNQNRFKWKVFQENYITNTELLKSINKIRTERNRIAHSTSLDKTPNQNLISEIEKIKMELKQIFTSYSDENKSNYSYYPSISELTGTLTKQTFYGPPSYGENPSTDRIEEAYILRLNAPINVFAREEKIEEGNFDHTFLNVQEVQLSVREKIDNLSECQIKATGVLYGAHTGHHRTKVLLDTEKIEQL